MDALIAYTVRAMFRLETNVVEADPMDLAKYLKISHQEAKDRIDELHLQLYGRKRFTDHA